MQLSGKTVVIFQGQLVVYAGSELVTLEVAEYFVENGAEVIVITAAFDLPLKAEFAKNNGIRVYEFDSPEIDELLGAKNIDIVWVHHSLIHESVIAKIGTKHQPKFIFNHMSSFHPLEFPINWMIESEIADVITFNAKTTKETILRKFDLKNIPHKIVMNNAAPKKFVFEKQHNDRLQRILVVSNHVPIEVKSALESLSHQGLDVRFYGQESSSPKRVSEKDIAWADVVVTIGKTVQYCLLSRTPVYVYEHFGGPGFLTSKNYKKTEDDNFSGRGFKKKTDTAIAGEILEHYDSAIKFHRGMSKHSIEKYLLDVQMNKILNRAYSNKTAAAVVDKNTLASQKILSELLATLISQSVTLYKDLDTKREKINKLRHQNARQKHTGKSIKARIVRTLFE